MKKDNKEYSIPNHGLNEEQKLKADEKLKRLRFESLANISDQQKNLCRFNQLEIQVD